MIIRLVALLLAVFFAGCSGKKVEYEDVEIGHRGPARQDPFLAASRFLDEVGHTSHKSIRLDECIKRVGTVITPLQSFVNHGETERALTWTKRGGHLVILLAGGESWRNDWSKFEMNDVWELIKKREVPEQEHLLKELGIKEVTNSGEEKADFKINRRKFACTLVGRIDFADKPERVDASAGKKDETAFISYRLGSGRITLLAHAHPWRNRYIGESDHAAMLASIVGLTTWDDVWFLNGVRISFWSMLWERAWLAIVALALLLLVWLARHFRRLGPVGLLKSESARDFSDHLLLTGAFLWRHREAGALVRPVQNAIHAAARRRGWHEMDDEFFRFITEASGLKPERARAILASDGPADPHAFRLLMHDLQKMLGALGGT